MSDLPSSCERGVAFDPLRIRVQDRFLLLTRQPGRFWCTRARRRPHKQPIRYSTPFASVRNLPRPQWEEPGQRLVQHHWNSCEDAQSHEFDSTVSRINHTVCVQRCRRGYITWPCKSVKRHRHRSFNNSYSHSKTQQASSPGVFPFLHHVYSCLPLLRDWSCVLWCPKRPDEATRREGWRKCIEQRSSLDPRL